MKKLYSQPEVEVTKLTAEDILDASPETDNEIFVDGEDIFGA